MDFGFKPVIGCIHLLPTPGAHMYDGNLDKVYETALSEAHVMVKHGVDALIVENFRDRPFYPDTVPPETVASIAGVSRELVRSVDVPVGVAVLRNDAQAAIAIATAVQASFVRINVHVGAALSAQGLLQGEAHRTLRLRRALHSSVDIYADAGVKHSTPYAYKDLAQEIKDLTGIAEAVIVSGDMTGLETATNDLMIANEVSSLPTLVGSGVTVSNLPAMFTRADGFIVGSYFKEGGQGVNLVQEARVEAFMKEVRSLRTTMTSC